MLALPAVACVSTHAHYGSARSVIVIVRPYVKSHNKIRVLYVKYVGLERRVRLSDKSLAYYEIEQSKLKIQDRMMSSRPSSIML